MSRKYLIDLIYRELIIVTADVPAWAMTQDTRLYKGLDFKNDNRQYLADSLKSQNDTC